MALSIIVSGLCKEVAMWSLAFYNEGMVHSRLILLIAYPSYTSVLQVDPPQRVLSFSLWCGRVCQSPLSDFGLPTRNVVQESLCRVF